MSRGVAQSGSASALGAEGRGFESLRPDHSNLQLPAFLKDACALIVWEFVGTLNRTPYYAYVMLLFPLL